MECSGVIEAVGADVHALAGRRRGLRAAGRRRLRRARRGARRPGAARPDGVDLVDAAGLPEVACTVWSTLVMAGGARRGETLLVHGGTGGIGTFAIQLGVALGLRVIVTAGSAAGRQRCLDLGAERAVDYHEEDFVEVVRELTDGRGRRRHPRRRRREVSAAQRLRAGHRWVG